MIHSALTILRKDLKLRVRDRSVLLFAFVVPLALTFVFSLIFPGEDDFLLTAAVANEDDGEVAAAFVDDALPALVEAGLVELLVADGEQAARRMVEDGDAAAAWVIPAGFSDAVMAGGSPQLLLLHNPDRALSTEVARGIASGFLGQIDRVTLAVATVAAGAGGSEPVTVDEAMISALAADVATAPSLVEVAALDAEARQLDPVSYLGAGMAVFFLFFTVTFGITGLLEEREQATLPRLLAAPVASAAIPVGKALGAFVVGVMSMAVLAIGNRFALGANWGPPLGVVILVLAGVLCALGVMALVGSFAKSVEQAGNLQAIVAMAFGLTGGVFFPVGATGWMANLSLVSPHGWFIRGLGDQVGAGTWTAVLPAAGALIAVAAGTGLVGALRWRKALT